MSAEQDSIKQQGSLLKSAKFKKDIARAEEIQAIALDTAKTLGARSVDMGERQKKVEQAIRQVAKDLEKGLL